MAHVAHLKGIQHCFEALIVSGWSLTLIFIVVAPLIGFVLAMLLMVAVYWLFRDFNPKRMDQYFRRLQLLSSAALSVSHGTNDAQKTMGIITAVLVSSKHLAKFEVPFWVLMSSYTVIALGTLSGGWSIIHTMGARLTKLKPRAGFARKPQPPSRSSSRPISCIQRRRFPPLTSLRARLRESAPSSDLKQCAGELRRTSSGRGF